jgi:hypothetical protein
MLTEAMLTNASAHPWKERLNSIYACGFNGDKSKRGRADLVRAVALNCKNCSRPHCKKGLVPTHAYYSQILRHRFVLSPMGRGVDTHRTWEILLLGAVPVIPYWLGIDTAYQHLPVVTISHPAELANSSHLLDHWNKKLERIMADPASIQLKLSATWWRGLVCVSVFGLFVCVCGRSPSTPLSSILLLSFFSFPSSPLSLSLSLSKPLYRSLSPLIIISSCSLLPEYIRSGGKPPVGSQLTAYSSS